MGHIKGKWGVSRGLGCIIELILFLTSSGQLDLSVVERGAISSDLDNLAGKFAMIGQARKPCCGSWHANVSASSRSREGGGDRAFLRRQHDSRNKRHIADSHIHLSATERRRKQPECAVSGTSLTKHRRKSARFGPCSVKRNTRSSSTSTSISTADCVKHVPSSPRAQYGSLRARAYSISTSHHPPVTPATPGVGSSRASARSLARHRSSDRSRALRSRAPWTRGWRAFLWNLWKRLMALEGWCEASWGGRAFVHVTAGTLASSHSLVGSLVVGLALWVSCAKRLSRSGGKGGWKQVVRVSFEVALLWYYHALPHGLGAGRPLRGNFGSGKVGDLLGAVWHFLGQGVFLRLVASSSRLVGVNVLEANCILLAISCLGNGLAGSRMRCIPGKDASEACTYQLRGFFSRINGIFRDRPVLSFPFDAADTLLALQGILSATEREVVKPDGAAAIAFREFASEATNTFDAHSLGALGARNLMGMGFVRARVRTFGRPAVSLGWTERANNMCMVGDPICGSLLQKLLDPTCVMLKGRGHFYDAYVACVGCGNHGT